MARIETDPNYNSPTFSRATAATDLFKKEDVQALAAAVSGHTHDGTGKGLTIATGSVTQAAFASGTTSGPVTTSTSFVDLPEMSVTMTTTGGRVVAMLTSSFVVTGTVGNLVRVALSLDGAAQVGEQQAMPGVANYRDNVTCIVDFGVLAAASHTIKGRWAVSGGEYSGADTCRNLLVLELKK